MKQFRRKKKTFDQHFRHLHLKKKNKQTIEFIHAKLCTCTDIFCLKPKTCLGKNKQRPFKVQSHRTQICRWVKSQQNQIKSTKCVQKEGMDRKSAHMCEWVCPFVRIYSLKQLPKSATSCWIAQVFRFFFIMLELLLFFRKTMHNTKNPPATLKNNVYFFHFLVHSSSNSFCLFLSLSVFCMDF